MATFASHISQWRKGLKLSAELSSSKHNLQHILLPPFSCLHCFREIRLVAFSCQPYGFGGAQCQDAPALAWFWGDVGVGGAQSATLCGL